MAFAIVCHFFFNDTATTEIYTLSLHDALPISMFARQKPATKEEEGERAVRRISDVSFAFLLRSEEHTSELQSLAYLVCRLLLEKKKKKKKHYFINKKNKNKKKNI